MFFSGLQWDGKGSLRRRFYSDAACLEPVAGAVDGMRFRVQEAIDEKLAVRKSQRDRGRERQEGERH